MGRKVAGKTKDGRDEVCDFLTNELEVVLWEKLEGVVSVGVVRDT